MLVSNTKEEQSAFAFLNKWSNSWILVSLYKVQCFRVKHKTKPFHSPHFLKEHGLQCSKFQCSNPHTGSTNNSVGAAFHRHNVEGLHPLKIWSSNGGKTTNVSLTGKALGKYKHSNKYFEITFKIHALLSRSKGEAHLLMYFATETSSVFLSTSGRVCYKWLPERRFVKHCWRKPGVKAGIKPTHRKSMVPLLTKEFPSLTLAYDNWLYGWARSKRHTVFVFRERLSWKQVYKVCKLVNMSLPHVDGWYNLRKLTEFLLREVELPDYIHIGVLELVNCLELFSSHKNLCCEPL